MPSKTEAQARMMAAIAHGWRKPGGGGPSRAVAEEFNREDTGGERLRKAMAHRLRRGSKGSGSRSTVGSAVGGASGGGT